MRGASNVRLLGFLGAALVLAVLWVVFGQIDNRPLPPPLETASLREIVGPLSAHVTERAAWLTAGFEDGRTTTTRDEDVRIEVRQVGTLQVRSGHIVATDPILLFPEPRAFARTVANGDYPVEVSIIHRPNGDQRIAMARVRINDHAPVAFQIAPYDGQSLEALIEAGEVTGHPVEAGTTAFLDADAALALWAERQSGRPHDRGFRDALGDAFEPTRSWATIDVEGVDGNLVMFSAGFGDAFCPSFWGYDAWGRIAVLVIDCDVLGEPDDEG
jgi:hypothetical protein